MSLERIFDRLRQLALTYPEAYEETPWGERALKVRGKAFLFVSRGRDKQGLFATLKLPETHGLAVGFEFAEPAGYGLGKSGWVTARFRVGDDVPTPLLEEWLEESFRAVAPKRVLKVLDGQEAPTPPGAKAAKSKAKKQRSKRAKVLLVGDDPLRLARAERGLAKRGVKQVSTTTQEGLPRLKARGYSLVVLDLGRRAVAGIEVAQDRLELKKDDRFVLAGVRDAKFEQRVRKALGPLGKRVDLHRRAPGDPAVLDALCERLP